MPALTRRSENAAAILLPEKIPVRIPIRVIPICTAERNLSGSEASFRAVLARLLPLSASAWRFDLRADTTAISDMENIPLSRIRKRIMKISLI